MQNFDGFDNIRFVDEEHLVAKITQKAIISNDNNEILFTKDISDQLWELPGGRLNVGETPVEGLVREIFEEVGLRIRVKAPYWTEISKNSKGETRFMVIYLCAQEDNNSEIHLQENEIEAHKWVGKDVWLELPLYPEYKEVLEKYFLEFN